MSQTSDQVRGILFRKRWTIQDLANYLGVSRRSVSRWLHDDVEPMPSLRRMLDRLGRI